MCWRGRFGLSLSTALLCFGFCFLSLLKFHAVYSIRSTRARVIIVRVDLNRFFKSDLFQVEVSGDWAVACAGGFAESAQIGETACLFRQRPVWVSLKGSIQAIR